MTTHKKVTGTASSMGGGLAMGALINIGITILGALVCASMLSSERIAESSIGYCSMTIILLSSILGSLTAVAKIKHRRIYVCALSGVIYLGMLLAATALFFGGQYQGIGVSSLLILAGCMATALLGLRGEKTRGAHKVKIRSR